MRLTLLSPLSFAGLLLGSAAQAATGVTGDLSRAFEVQPGQTLQVPITLSNTGKAAETVRLSLQDMRVLPGGTTYLPAGKESRSNALWAKLPAATLTVPAGTTRDFNVAITVPQDAAPGAHWSALIVQPDRPPTAARGQVIVNTRYAVNLITTVPGGAPRIRFANPNIGRIESNVQLSVELMNDGTATTVPQYRAEVYDPQGKLVTRAEAGKKRLYPDGGVRVDFGFGKLAAGKYTFVVMANDGVNPVVGKRYTVNVEN